jgi:hypothetical protein
MRKTFTALVVAFALSVFTSPLSATPQQPASTGAKVAPSLAKAKLKDATAAALKWRTDAVLIQILARNIGVEGTAVLWDYGFYSKSARTCLVVRVASTVFTTESGGEACESPALTGEFMDSDQAIKLARANGITHQTATMVVSISPLTKRPFWSVMDERGMKPGNVMLDLDGATGKVLHKTTQK